MITSKTKILECKVKSIQFQKSLDAGIDVCLVPEIVIPVFGDRHHVNPIVSGLLEIFFEFALSTFFKILNNPAGPLAGALAVACRARHILEIVVQ